MARSKGASPGDMRGQRRAQAAARKLLAWQQNHYRADR